MGELRRITREVSTEFEIAAGIRKMSDIQGPALLFENVAGHSMPVVGGLFSTRRRALLALDVDTHADGNERFLQGLRQQIAPVVVGEGPCQEVVLTGDEVDLFALPIPRYSEKDGGAYITVGLEISKDPLDGRRNASV